jgi:hypothetical protein
MIRLRSKGEDSYPKSFEQGDIYMTPVAEAKTAKKTIKNETVSKPLSAYGRTIATV